MAENRRRVVDAVMPGAALVTPHQMHSANAVVVTEPWGEDERLQALSNADAVVTARANILLGIVTADCAPVLLADPGAGVVAAAHAGWRGAKGGVLQATITTMERLGADRAAIVAAIGPTIAQASYEVDGAFKAGFGVADARFFASGKAGHWQFDLPGYVHARLIRCGIGQVRDLAQDTYAEADRFYSYRRATHAGEPTDGRQISVIGLR